MSSFIYPTDQQIVEPLTKSIEYFHNAFGTSSLYPLPPSAEQLKELLNCAFAASLETEEGRRVAFTVSFFADQECKFPYSLKESLPLSPRDLVRLAVALDPSRTRICVIAGSTSLKIAGLVHLGEQETFHGGRQTVPQLSIRVLGPGILLVRYADNLLFTYRRGKYAFHAGDLQTYGRKTIVDEFAVGRLLLHQGYSGNAEELKATLRLAALLKRIARSMLRSQHGGTLLIVPAAFSSPRAPPAVAASISTVTPMSEEFFMATPRIVFRLLCQRRTIQFSRTGRLLKLDLTPNRSGGRCRLQRLDTDHGLPWDGPAPVPR